MTGLLIILGALIIGGIVLALKVKNASQAATPGRTSGLKLSIIPKLSLPKWMKGITGVIVGITLVIVLVFVLFFSIPYIFNGIGWGWNTFWGHMEDEGYGFPSIGTEELEFPITFVYIDDRVKECDEKIRGREWSFQVPSTKYPVLVQEKNGKWRTEKKSVLGEGSRKVFGVEMRIQGNCALFNIRQGHLKALIESERIKIREAFTVQVTMNEE